MRNIVRTVRSGTGLEMKEILNSVVQAEKAAQANVIRRREEANATRSLLNTARLIEESPVLMRLKELEALAKVTEKIDKLTVFGGLDGVMKQLVELEAVKFHAGAGTCL